MQALVYHPGAPAELAFDEVAEPTPTDGQALVEVRAIAVNFGEIAYISNVRKPGEVVGCDAAGVVVRAAADGSGPAVGTPVTTFGWSGGWARLRAVDTDQLAVVAGGVDFGAASALPAAGVTALQAVRGLGAVLGRRVLITGASGGVARFAVQLAARAGAHVVAAVGAPGRGEGLTELGTAEVVVGLDGVKPVHGVLDNVGGDLLATAFSLLEPGGTAFSIGKASRRPSVIDFEAERQRGRRGRLVTFLIDSPIGADLAYLVSLLETKTLDPQIGWRGSWDRAGEAATALLSRQVRGKAVLDL